MIQQQDKKSLIPYILDTKPFLDQFPLHFPYVRGKNKHLSPLSHGFFFTFSPSFFLSFLPASLSFSLKSSLKGE